MSCSDFGDSGTLVAQPSEAFVLSQDHDSTYASSIPNNSILKGTEDGPFSFGINSNGDTMNNTMNTHFTSNSGGGGGGNGAPNARRTSTSCNVCDAESPSWKDFEARLSPLNHIPMDKLVYYETTSNFFIVATNKKKEQYRLIKFAKDDTQLNYFIDNTVYTKDEINEITAMLLKNKQILNTGKARAILGFVRFTKGYHILLVIRRKQIGRIGPHRVYEVRDTQMLSLCEPDPKRRPEETMYRDLFRQFELKEYFYYSHSYDLSNTLQDNMTTRQAKKAVRKKYVWNEQLLSPMYPEEKRESGTLESGPLAEEVPGVEDFGAWSPWVVRVIHGCFVQAAIELGARRYQLILIGKSSVNYAGARYLKRGVNDLGHVANHVEVEQIIVDEDSLFNYETQGRFASFVQVRGSVPVHWAHPMVNRPKPPIALVGSDATFEATKSHFQELMADLGEPIVILNFLKSREGKTREGVLTSEYVKAVQAITKDMDPQDPKIKYVAYDLRNSAGRAWNSLMSIAEQHIDPIGFFATDERRVRLQNGVARSNCVDCIDRTNLGQYFIGLNTLAHMMSAIGAISTPTELALIPDVSSLLLSLYLDLGDAIAKQYGGSAQVGVGVVDRGMVWDKMMGIQRLYTNFIQDKDKQAVMNLFLRLYEPCPLDTSCQHTGRQMTLPAFQPADTTINKMFGVFGGKKEPVPVDPRRVVDLNSLESDYYLHVPTAPKLFKTFTKKWWEEPLHRFYNRCDLTVISRQRAMSVMSGFTTIGDDGLLHSITQQTLEEETQNCWYLLRDKTLVDSESDDEIEYHKPIDGDAGPLILDRVPTLGECCDERWKQRHHHDRPAVSAKTDSFHSIQRSPMQQGRAGSPLPPTCGLDGTATFVDGLKSQTQPALTCTFSQHGASHVAPKPYFLCPEEGPAQSYLPEQRDDEFIHDHQAYPYEVLNSRHLEDAVWLSQFENEPKESNAGALVSFLIPLGDPREWSYEQVINAMELMNTDGSLDDAIIAIDYTKMSMSSLMRMKRDILERSFDYDEEDVSRSVRRRHSKKGSSPPSLKSSFVNINMAAVQSGSQVQSAGPRYNGRQARPISRKAVAIAQAVRNFVECVARHYPFPDEGVLNDYLALGTTEIEGLEFPDSSAQFSSHVATALENFTTQGVHPSMVDELLRFWMDVMLDPETGVELGTKVRFVEGGAPALTIPPHVILYNVAFAVDIKHFVVENSKKMKLKVHLQKSESKKMEMATQFLRIFIKGGLLRCLDVQVEANQKGVVALPQNPDEINDNFRLFTFFTAERKIVLNTRPPQSIERSVSSPSRETTRALEMAEAFASFCFAQLRTFFETMSSDGPEGAQLVMENIQNLVVNLANIDLTLLGNVARKCFFTNVFNCLYIHAWITACSQESVTNFVVMYQTYYYNIGGCQFSLADIKHGILRRNLCAPRMVLPQFAQDDIRRPLMINKEDGNYRILFSLIDAYLMPENLHEVKPFTIDSFAESEVISGSTSPTTNSPGVVVNFAGGSSGISTRVMSRRGSFASGVSGTTPSTSVTNRGTTTPATSVSSRIDAAIAAQQHLAATDSSQLAPQTPRGSSAVNPNVSSNLAKLGDEFIGIEEYGLVYDSASDDEDSPLGNTENETPTNAGDSPPITPSEAGRGKPYASFSGANPNRRAEGLLNWFMGGKNKVSSVVHFCEPLLPQDVEVKLADTETSFLAMSLDVTGVSFTTQVGSQCPKLCQSFIGMDEFGRTPEEVMRTFQKIWKTSRRKNALLAGSLSAGGTDMLRDQLRSTASVAPSATPYGSPMPSHRNRTGWQ